MNEKDKDLLLKDLCARLPYGVKVNVIYSNENASSFRQRVCIDGDNELNTDIIGLYHHNEIDIKPYLFPLSSMTEEQKYEYDELIHSNNIKSIEGVITSTDCSVAEIDWLLKNYFDYRGLIEKGLAIDATGLNIY